MNKGWILVIIAVVFFSGCIKKPEKLYSPGVRVDISVESNKEVYLLTLSAGVVNENHSTAITDYKAYVNIKESDKGEILASLPIEAKAVLPLETYYFEVKKKVSEAEAMLIVDALAMNREELMKTRTASSMFIDEKNIEIADLSYKTEDIQDLLKGKMNEKN